TGIWLILGNEDCLAFFAFVFNVLNPGALWDQGHLVAGVVGNAGHDEANHPDRPPVEHGRTADHNDLARLSGRHEQPLDEGKEPIVVFVRRRRRRGWYGGGRRLRRGRHGGGSRVGQLGHAEGAWRRRLASIRGYSLPRCESCTSPGKEERRAKLGAAKWNVKRRLGFLDVNFSRDGLPYYNRGISPVDYYSVFMPGSSAGSANGAMRMGTRKLW